MGLGKLKPFYYWLTLGKTNAVRVGNTTSAVGSFGLGGMKIPQR